MSDYGKQRLYKNNSNGSTRETKIGRKKKEL